MIPSSRPSETRPGASRLRKSVTMIAVPSLVLAGLLTVPSAALAEDSASFDFSSGYNLGFQQPGNVTVDWDADDWDDWYEAGEVVPWQDENGWKMWFFYYDWALVENEDFTQAGLGDEGVSLRFSNWSSNAKQYGNINQLHSPAIEPAGEPFSGAVNNTFEANFTIASSTGALQERLAVEIALDSGVGNRGGGVVQAIHGDGGLQFAIVDYDWDAATGTWAGSRQTRYSAEFPVDVAHRVRIVVHYVTDGPDWVKVFVDDVLAVEGSNWEGRYAPRIAEGTSEPEETWTTGMLFRAATALAGTPNTVLDGEATAPMDDEALYFDALEGEGFLFTDLSMRSYNIFPEEPPASLPSEPGTPTVGTELEISDDEIAPGDEIEGVATGFLPGELVGFTWYSTPVFAGWSIADADGVATKTFVPPPSLGAGAHTLQATGATSGRIAISRFQLSGLAATGGEALPILTLGGFILAGGLALMVASAKRRRGATTGRAS